MPGATAARVPDRAPSRRDGLRCRIRLADRRVFVGKLAPARHRALQFGMLHAQTGGLVELAAGSRRDGRLHITTPGEPTFPAGRRRRRPRVACCSGSPGVTPSGARCSSRDHEHGVVTGTINGTTTELVVVRVKDAVNSSSPGAGTSALESPPLPLEEAMTLVRLLLGRRLNSDACDHSAARESLAELHRLEQPNPAQRARAGGQR